MGFKTQDGFQFTGSGDGLKYVSGKRISFYISEQGDVGSGDAGVYSGTSGIVSTYIVLDLNTTNSSSYGGSGTTWSDISGNSNDGTLENGVSYSSTDGGYLIFDGSDDFVSFTDSSDFAVGTGDFTSESWIQLNNSSGHVRLLTFVNPSNASNTLTFTLKNTEIYLYSDITGGYALRVQSLTNNVSTWYHIVFSRISGTLKLYINAVEAGSTSFTENITWQSLLIGKNKSGSSFSDANHAQSRLYKGIGLTASEVLQNYLATGSNYFGDIVTTGLVLYLDASNNMSYSGSGTTWTDISGQGNNGTLVNGVTYNSGDGGYFIFDGTDDAATVPVGSDFVYGTGDFTVEIWFNVTGTSPAAYGEILYAQQGSGHNYFILASSEYSPVQKKPTFIFGTSGGGAKTSSSTTYAEGVWHHFVVTRNGTTATLYLDNNSVGTVTCSQDFNNTTYVPTIGSNTQQSFGHFDGKISQLRIYKGKGFSASEVTQNYDATKSNYSAIITTNLVLHLNTTISSSYSGSGTTWTDISGYGNDATLYNSPTYSSSEGGYLDFDGTNDYATFDAGSDTAFGTGNFTIEIWASFAGEGSFYFIDTRNSSQTTNWAYYVNSEEMSIWFTGSAAHFYNDSSVPIWNTGENGWNHIVFSREGTGSNEFKIYVNGQHLSSTTDTTDYSNSSSEVSIGRRYSNSEFLDGKLSQLRIYKGKGLTASEVLTNYNATKSNYILITTNLVLHLDATNSSSYSGSGTTWTDLSGNNYDGTLVNGVSYSSSDGGYLDFDGTNDYVSFSSYTQPAHTSSTSFTWFIWVYPSESGTDNVIMGNRDVSGSNKWTKITPKRFEWVYPDHLDGTGTTVTANQWQNICITKNGSSFTYYKNGSSIDTVTSSASKDSNPFYLGGDPVYNEHTNCRISIVAVYDAALSASDVLQNYNVTKHLYGL